VVTDGDAMGALRKESSVAAFGDGPASWKTGSPIRTGTMTP